MKSLQKTRAKAPALLIRLQAGVRRAIPPALLGSKGEFVHLHELNALRAAISCPWSSPAKRIDNKRFRLRLMGLVAPFIRAIWPDVLTGRAWGHTTFCPNTAIGSYCWPFQAELVQELLWLRPEFIAGFRYAMSDIEELSRDENPYPYGDARRGSWDSGYILGLANLPHSPQRPAMKKWILWLESPDALPAQAKS